MAARRKTGDGSHEVDIFLRLPVERWEKWEMSHQGRDPPRKAVDARAGLEEWTERGRREEVALSLNPGVQ